MKERIREMRRQNGLTQAELAVKLGISASAVGMYEQGRREPDHEILRRMASVFHCSIDYLVGAPEGRELDRMIDDFTRTLKDYEGLMFHGKPVTESERERIVDAIWVAAAVAAPEVKKDV